MNAPRPPPYNQPEPDDEDEDAIKWPVLWGRVQSGLIILAVILTITELILVVTNRELAQKALRMARKANGVVTDQFNQMATDVSKLRNGFSNLTESVDGMHKSFVDLKEDVEIIQTKVKVLESAIPTTSSSSAMPSESYYYSSGEKHIPGVALGLMLVEGVAVVVL